MRPLDIYSNASGKELASEGGLAVILIITGPRLKKLSVLPLLNANARVFFLFLLGLNIDMAVQVFWTGPVLLCSGKETQAKFWAKSNI